MLKINNLTITTHTGRVLLKDFSFNLNNNDKIALIGEEGNGKSTLLKIISGIDVSDYVSYEGDIICSDRISYLPQTIEEKYLDLEVLEYINDDIDYNHLYSLAIDLNINIDLLENRKLKTLSGGEKIKVSLLKILYNYPDILLLDEPTNDIDLKSLIWLEEFILNLNIPVLFISHDESLLERCANGILHLEQLKRKTEAHMTYSGSTYNEYLKYRTDLINKTNMLAKKEKAEFNKQLDKWRQIYQKVDHAQKTITRADPHSGRLLKKKMHAVKSLQRNLDIKKENLTKKYEPEEAINIFFDDIDINPNKELLDLSLDELKINDRLLSKNIHLKVLGKDKICIIGNNGSGKSTLIKIIYKILKDRSDIKLGYMPQNYYEVMDYNLNPIEYLWNKESIKDRIKIQNYLGALKFKEEEMNHSIAELSEGQKCKILLIKMILDKCDVLLIDEATRNLSPLSNPKVREILNNYSGTIISVSHDRKFINEVVDKVYELNDNGLKLIS